MSPSPKKLHSSSPRESPPLASKLDEMARRFGPGHLAFDPIRFPRRYEDPRDREAVALMAALFAYGNVKAMGDYLEGLLHELGPSPVATLAGGKIPRGLKPYRFQTGAEARRLLAGLGRVLSEFGSIEAVFCAGTGGAEQRLEAFANRLREHCGRPSRGLLHLMPLPSDGSACKRWWMFLRWVVRPDDGVDLGLWSCLSPADLRMPVDTHVARIACALGLSRRKTADRAFAVELTEVLRRFCPEDPTCYDFALAHMGISRECPGKPVEAVCAECSLRAHCKIGDQVIR